MKKILILNGPNINLTGLREKSVYGAKTFDDLLALCHEEAQKLGVEPGELCVFEDALYSMKAAKEAGCPVMAILDPAYQYDWEEIKALSDHWFTDYSELL